MLGKFINIYFHFTPPQLLLSRTSSDLILLYIDIDNQYQYKVTYSCRRGISILPKRPFLRLRALKTMPLPHPWEERHCSKATT